MFAMAGRYLETVGAKSVVMSMVGTTTQDTDGCEEQNEANNDEHNRHLRPGGHGVFSGTQVRADGNGRVHLTSTSPTAVLCRLLSPPLDRSQQQNETFFLTKRMIGGNAWNRQRQGISR